MQRNGGECNFTHFCFQNGSSPLVLLRMLKVSVLSAYFRNQPSSPSFLLVWRQLKNGCNKRHKVLSNSKALATFFVNIIIFPIVSLTAWGPQQPGKYQKSIGPDLAFVWAGSEPSSPTWRAVGDVDNSDNSNSGFIDFDRGLIDRRPCPKKQNSFNGFSTTGPTNPITAMFSNLSVETRTILYSFVSIYCTI